MFAERRSQKSLEKCSVRAIDRQPLIQADASHTLGSMICAKYPEGIIIKYNTLEVDYTRRNLSLNLGCGACPYKNKELPTGIPAKDAILDISTSSVDLNRAALLLTTNTPNA